MAAKMASAESPNLFSWELTVQSAHAWKEFSDTFTSAQTWAQGSKDNMGNLKKLIKCDIKPAIDAIMSEGGLLHHVNLGRIEQWKNELAQCQAKLKESLPPSALLSDVSIFSDASQQNVLATHTSKLMSTGAMQGSSKLLMAIQAYEKEAGVIKHELFEEKKELLKLKGSARRAICLEWSSAKLLKFVANGPESLVQFSEEMLSKLAAKGMSDKAGDYPVPESLQGFLDSM